MIRTHLKTLILTSVLILLPIPVGLLLWNRFTPDVLPGQFATVWMMPLIMLATHWFCMLITTLDPGNKGRNKKTLTMVLWLIPMVTWFCCGLMYALYLGLAFSSNSWMLLMMGIMFIVIGNYMPKTRMNGTVGIKVPWTYSSEENWSATHRYAGKVWVIGGILMLTGIFLPDGIGITLFFLDTVVICVLPMVYSWKFWKTQKSDGAELKSLRTINPKLTKTAAVFLTVILAFILSVLFVGNIEYRMDESSFTIEADWYSDLTVQYDAIKSLEYREINIPGTRVGGFGSLRLLMGYFRNHELGTYIRYTYYNPESCILLTTDRYRLVLSGKTVEETEVLYHKLLTLTRQ